MASSKGAEWDLVQRLQEAHKLGEPALAALVSLLEIRRTRALEALVLAPPPAVPALQGECNVYREIIQTITVKKLAINQPAEKE